MVEPRQRVIASGLTAERPAMTTTSHTHTDALTSFVLVLGRPMWAYRIELALIGVTALVWGLIALLIESVFGGEGVVAGAVVTAFIVGVLAYQTRPRQTLVRLLRRRAVRRDFDQACRYGLVVTMNDRTPRPISVRFTPTGEVLTVQMPPSMSTLPLCDASEVLASGMAVREVRVQRDPNRADRATVSIIRRDPLGDSAVLSWPNLDAGRLSMKQPIPFGINEHGEPVSVCLTEQHIVTAGVPGSGKSVNQSLIVAQAALDPNCELYLFDANQVEFRPWAKCATEMVGPDFDQAISVLISLGKKMDQRYEELLKVDARKIDEQHRQMVVVINELAYYLTMGERKQNQEFERLLRDLVARGRAAGVIVCVATQRPSSDIVATSLRDLFTFRLALRCTTPQASDTILGQGWASMSSDRASRSNL